MEWKGRLHKKKLVWRRLKKSFSCSPRRTAFIFLFFFPPCPREQELEVEKDLALEKKSKATPTFLLVFFTCLLTVPMVYFVRKGYATHRAAVPASVNRESLSVVESTRSESSAVKTEGYGAA